MISMTTRSFPYLSFAVLVRIRLVLGYSGEYCETEVFRAECPEDHVILMDRARYGRMFLGRCVEEDLGGHVGCFRDVLHVTDRRCSGRRVCEIRVPDAEMERLRPCLKELKTYLDVGYRCVEVLVERVMTEDCGKHSSDGGYILTSSSGYISSDASTTTSTDLQQIMAPCLGWTHLRRGQADVSDRPLIITGLPGQRINLTLYDFTIVPLRAVDDVTNMSNSYNRRNGTGTREALSRLAECRIYGRVGEVRGRRRERGGKASEEEEELHPICGADKGTDRVRQVFSSDGNKIKIWIEAKTSRSSRFLLRYIVYGCSDMDDQELDEKQLWFRRMDNNHNLAVIGCLSRLSITWSATCVNKLWVGEYGNCSGLSLRRDVVKPLASVAMTERQLISDGIETADVSSLQRKLLKQDDDDLLQGNRRPRAHLNITDTGQDNGEKMTVNIRMSTIPPQGSDSSDSDKERLKTIGKLQYLKTKYQ